MFQNVFVIPCIATILYFIVRAVEAYSTDKEEHNIPLKIIMRDAFLVFICTILSNGLVMILNGHFHQLMNIVTEKKSVLPEGPPNVFTDEPVF